MEPLPVVSPGKNQEMVCWIRKILGGELSFLEKLTPDDWARFIAFAQKQSTAPILYHAIKDSPPGSLLEPTLDELRNIYLGSAVRNVILYSELGKILRALQKSDIPVIVLKGACLAESVYGNIALRSMGDVDILVKKNNLGNTVQILNSMGYSADDFQAENQGFFGRHLPRIKAPNKPPIEVHWTIFSSMDFEAPDEKEIVKIWERARPSVVAGTPCLMLAPEDLLLHLCCHISRQHLFNMRLRGFLDLRKVVEYYDNLIDWDVMQQRACHWRIDRAVRLTIFIAERWVGLELPDRVKQAWKPEHPSTDIMNWIKERMLAEQPLLETGRNFLELKADKSITDKIGILWRAFFPPRAKLSIIYKVDPRGGKIYFFYPVRWFSLCRRFVPTVWKAWKGDVTVVTALQNEITLRQWFTQA